MNSNNLPIGVFDSGFGGLSVLKELSALLPNEDFIYFADNYHAPFGDKSFSEIKSYTKKAVDFFKQKKIKALVIACNTTAALSFEDLKKEISFPVIDVIFPLVEKAILLKKIKVGLIATVATVKSQIYTKSLQQIDPQIKVIEVACPSLVPLIEKGDFQNPEIENALEKYLFPLKEEKIDLLLLGCTHYPLIKNQINDFFGAQIEVIDSSKVTSLVLKNKLIEKNLFIRKAKTQKLEFYVTKNSDNFCEVAKKILGKRIEKVILKR